MIAFSQPEPPDFFDDDDDPSEHYYSELANGSSIFAKATTDIGWRYLVEIQSGKMFLCDGVKPSDQWAALINARPVGWGSSISEFTFGRHVEIRFDAITMVADCDS